MSALLQAPSSTDFEPPGAISDHTLVAQVRRGDERAFEALYERYHRRIHAYVFGMVKDHQRAEDVTQEVFVSALRRMRATERPIAFKPWVYEIAKNACIDQFRRAKRAEEVSYDADEGLAPSDYGRLVSTEPVPDAALVAKQQLDDLCGAFGGLSEAHHQILVLRELEGLSYKQIGEKMGMSRPAVESTLFRARRRLTEEYDDLASGQRCVRIQSIIVNASSGRLGARDTRRLARHVAHCQPCRRQAVAAGVDSALVARRPVRQRAMEKVAALLPFPLLLRGRRGGAGSESWATQLPAISDHAAAGGAKLVAVAALVVAGLGAGVGTQTNSGARDERSPARPAKAVERNAGEPVRAPGAAAPAVTGVRRPAGERSSERRARTRAAAGLGEQRSARGLGAPAVRKPTAGAERPQQSGAGQAPAAGEAAPTDAVPAPVQEQAPETGAQAPVAPAPPAAPPAPNPDEAGREIQLQLPAAPDASVPASTIDPVETVGALQQSVPDATEALGGVAPRTAVPAATAVVEDATAAVAGE